MSQQPIDYPTPHNVFGASRASELVMRSKSMTGKVLSGFAMLTLASITMALGAATMFALQPMIGKLLAPWLGSVPAVWTTCMLFFQMVLLGGYVYVHILTKLCGMKMQLLVHLAVVVLSVFALPLRLPELMTDNIPESGYHAHWIFATLMIAVGAPAFVLAATAPLVQAWFRATTHKMATNPYPLYIASNTGSLLGLLSYPFVVEPSLTLTTQRFVWSFSWLAYVVLLATVAVLCWRHRKLATPGEGSEAAITGARAPATWSAFAGGLAEKGNWIALSFIPSSLLLGVTSHITTDIAAMPMLWTIPLAIYLLSWTFSFADYAPWLHRMVEKYTPLSVIAVAFVWSAGFLEPIRWLLLVHMVALLMICWSLHRRLYESRPDASRLTSFYISIALGGALGGIFNALIAPQVFSGFAEYPLALVLSLLFLPNIPSFGDSNRSGSLLARVWQQLVIVSLVVISTATLSKYANLSIRWSEWSMEGVSSCLGWTKEQVEKWAEFALPLVPAFLLLGRPKLQALGTCTALIVGIMINHSSNVLLQERSFFGVLTIREYSQNGGMHSLIHGGILHGEQWIGSEGDRLEARSYYHKEGPLGDVMDIMARTKDGFTTAAIGLGTGSVAAYGQANRPIIFFEIDANVEAIARNRYYFTYVSDSVDRGCPLDVRIGDARVTMARSEDVFDLILIDAFSSDAIPLHLITKEAIDVWFRHLKTDGVVAFHVSNRYLDLSPVLGNAAEQLGVAAYQRVDTYGDKTQGRGGSNWIVLTRDPVIMRWFASQPEWTLAPTRPDIPVWTDDFASVLPVFRF